MGFLLLETAHEGLPPWSVFLIALAILLSMLFIVRGIGKGRPHS